MESIILIPKLVGSNQIKTVFDRECEQYINLEGYDCIGPYYLRPEDFEATDDKSEEY